MCFVDEINGQCVQYVTCPDVHSVPHVLGPCLYIFNIKKHASLSAILPIFYHLVKPACRRFKMTH